MRKLYEGSYILAADIDNPSADRRRRRDSRFVPVWRAGTRLRLDRCPIYGGWEIVFVDDTPYPHSIKEYDTRFWRVAEAMVPVSEPFDVWYARVVGVWAEGVIEYLLNRGTLSQTDIETIVNTLKETD